MARVRTNDRVGRPCPYCRRTMLPEDRALALGGEHVGLAATIEHIRTQASGGTNEPINLIIACKRCNNLRGHLDYELFCGFARNVIQQYPYAPTRVLRKMLRDYVDALAEYAGRNKRAVRSAIRFSLLVNADQLERPT